MNITYFIQIGAKDGGPCRWARFNGTAAVGSVSHGPLEDALEAAQGQSVVIFPPATDITLTTVDALSRNRRQLATAIPYMLEDELAEDVENLHFSIHEKSTDGKLLCSVIARTKIGMLIEALHGLEFKSVSVVPFSLCVPFEQDEWTLFIDDGTAILRTSPVRAIAVDTGSAALVLESLVDAFHQENEVERERVPLIRLYDFRTEPKPILSDDQQIAAVVESVETPHGEGAALILAAQNWFGRSDPVNLLQGDYLVSNQISDHFRKWAVAASLAGISVLLMLASKGIDNAQLAGESDMLDNQIRALYLEAFPGDEIKGNPVGEMRKRMSKLKGSSSGPGETAFLRLMAVGGRHLLVSPESTIVSLRFRNSALEIDIETNSIDVLETLQRKIAAEAVGVELKSVTSSGGKVRGRLLLSMEAKA